MVPDKFNMVDMDGIDLIMMQGEEVPGLYMRLVESIAQCRYQCLYNWFFDGVVIPPTYVRLEVNEDDEVAINEGVTVSPDDVIHIHTLEHETIPLLAEENGTYNAPPGVDGFNPVTVEVTPVINPITITENGTYNAPSGVDGYAPVVVNVIGHQPNVWNWKRYRQLAGAYNGGSLSFISDNSFELTGNGRDVFTFPNGLVNNNNDAQYPAVQGQKFVLRWDVDPDYISANAQIYIFEGASTTNMSLANYGAGELLHTVVGSTPRLSIRFGNKENGVTLKYYNCRFYIDEQ